MVVSSVVSQFFSNDAESARAFIQDRIDTKGFTFPCPICNEIMWVNGERVCTPTKLSIVNDDLYIHCTKCYACKLRVDAMLEHKHFRMHVSVIELI